MLILGASWPLLETPSQPDFQQLGTLASAGKSMARTYRGPPDNVDALLSGTLWCWQLCQQNIRSLAVNQLLPMRGKA